MNCDMIKEDMVWYMLSLSLVSSKPYMLIYNVGMLNLSDLKCVKLPKWYRNIN